MENAKKISLKKLILLHLKNNYPSYVHKGVIDKLAVNEWKYESETAGRRCRDLVREGKIERDPDSSQAIYRYIPEAVEQDFTIQPLRQEAMFKVGGYRG